MRNWSKEVEENTSIHASLVEGEVHAIKHTYFLQVSVSHEEQMSPWILVLFQIQGDI